MTRARWTRWAIRRVMTRVLPGAGAGEDEQRPVAVEDRLALRIVQAVEDADRLGQGGALRAVHGRVQVETGFSRASGEEIHPHGSGDRANGGQRRARHSTLSCAFLEEGSRRLLPPRGPRRTRGNPA